MICKIIFSKQIHLLPQPPTYCSLVSFIRTKFYDLPANFDLTYFDQQGDEIMLNSEDDMKAFIIIQQSQQRFQKIYVKEGCERRRYGRMGKEVGEGMKEVELQVGEEVLEVKDTEEIARKNDILRGIAKRLEKGIQSLGESEVMFTCVREQADKRNKRIVRRILEEEEEEIAELVNNYSSRLYRRVEKHVHEEELEDIKDLARQTVDRITYASIANYLKMIQKQKPMRPHRSKSSEYKKDLQIQRLVEKKLSQLLPNIIDRVSCVIQQRLHRKSPNLSLFPHPSYTPEHRPCHPCALSRTAYQHSRHSLYL